MVKKNWLRCRLSGRRKGQAIVEFALIVPIFLLLVLGVYEFGRAWNVYQVVTDAAREGARVAVIANLTVTRDTVAKRINENLFRARLDTAAAVKTITGCCMATGSLAGSTTVSISYPYQLRWIQSMMGWTGAQASFSMNTSVVFRNEY